MNNLLCSKRAEILLLILLYNYNKFFLKIFKKTLKKIKINYFLFIINQ